MSGVCVEHGKAFRLASTFSAWKADSEIQHPRLLLLGSLSRRLQPLVDNRVVAVHGVHWTREHGVSAHEKKTNGKRGGEDGGRDSVSLGGSDKHRGICAGGWAGCCGTRLKTVVHVETFLGGKMAVVGRPGWLQDRCPVGQLVVGRLQTPAERARSKRGIWWGKLMAGQPGCAVWAVFVEAWWSGGVSEKSEVRANRGVAR